MNILQKILIPIKIKKDFSSSNYNQAKIVKKKKKMIQMKFSEK